MALFHNCLAWKLELWFLLLQEEVTGFASLPEDTKVAMAKFLLYYSHISNWQLLSLLIFLKKIPLSIFF